MDGCNAGQDTLFGQKPCQQDDTHGHITYSFLLGSLLPMHVSESSLFFFQDGRDGGLPNAWEESMPSHPLHSRL